ncbi:hypothetical protein C1645_820819 [Glomus cerebriforme]|uniref:Uncharacterized protein n=1 Tax=Glomus cerebriforme TaxID=658196 RepID=A0A397T654_9GLOM|nr:hypothetical protein C1645_820819 [Glomus cerebriforme]
MSMIENINKELRNISDDFPDGLQYVKPKPLLSTIGYNWVYQPDPSLYQILQKEFKNHYKYYRQGQFRQSYMPMYFFLSGAGTGKSRNATEFYNTTIKCFEKEGDSELKNMIQNALVFNITFENDTSLRQEVELDAYKAIGTRMLLQLLHTMNIDEIISTYKAPNPWEVLQLIAKNKKQDLKRIPVFLIVDALQHIMYNSKENIVNSENNNTINSNDNIMNSKKFYQTIMDIGDLGCKGTFLIPCCTATITGPIDSFLNTLYRKCIYLPVPSLHPPTVYQKDTKKSTKVFQQNFITEILVGDCGGHGRALEILQKVLMKYNINECNLDLLMDDLYNSFTKQYVDAFNLSDNEAKIIAKAILTHQLLDLDEEIPKTNKTPNQLLQNGLIRFERVGPSTFRTGYLTVPYIWIWILAEKIGVKELLQKWQFEEQKLKSTSKVQFWRNFEHFIATFRCLKSQIIENELTKISEVHSGARLNGDIEFKNHPLELEIVSNPESTNSENTNNNVICEDKIINFQQGKHCLVNYSSDNYGDSFIRLNPKQNKSLILNEVHQYKFWNDEKVNQEVYLKERKKAASKSDFFILFTTKNCNKFELPQYSGIVDKENWNKYFGPFAHRAYRFATPLDINTANYIDLQQIRSIGPKNAREILSKRPFTDITNAMKKTGLGKNVLEKFRFSIRNYHHNLVRASRNICHFI